MYPRWIGRLLKTLLPAGLQTRHLLLILDLLGTATFAAEGASAAMVSHLDLLGVLVLSFVTALGGGIVRDLLISSSPPNSIKDWRYAACALSAGAAVFAFHTASPLVHPLPILILDAAGLSFFAVAGAGKALDRGIHPLLATMMGGVTAVGGGTLRDLLINRVPLVLQTDVYASAALLGAGLCVTALKFRRSPAFSSTIGLVACFALRMTAVLRHWNLPRA